MSIRFRVGALLLSVMLIGWIGRAAPGAEPAALEGWTWQPRGRSIAVDTVSDPPADAGSIAGVRIRGRIEEGWNYALTQRQPVVAGQLYRLSARVRVDRLGPTTPPPYFKCEFVAEPPGRTSKQAHTEPYDVTRPGTWQVLAGEFRVPDDARACWLALEKGTHEPAEVDALVGQVRLEPIARLTAVEACRLAPLPASLERMRGVHPRLYLTSDRAKALREAVRGSHAAIWSEVRERADRAVKAGPPAYVEHDRYSGDEQLWQREVGNTLPLLALAYVVTGQGEYLASARDWSLASCRYKTWGLNHFDGKDLAAGHQLYGLALVYDWCHADLDAPVRREIRDTLVRRASAMFQAAVERRVGWHRAYLQNHLWVNAAGLALAGLALFDEEDDAALWIGLALDKFRQTNDALGSDGASHEGAGYWQYGVEYLLKFMEPAETLLEVNLYDHPWWRNTAAYGQYLMLPRNAWRRDQCLVDLADCPRGNWYGPEYLLRRLASRFGDGHAQWLAAEIDDSGVAAPSASWLNVLWHDPAVAPQPPGDLPTLRAFDDMGIVSARSDWSGDESLVVFKCGPFIGREAVERFSYDPGGGHVHPDANHFVLFSQGEWLIRDDGYHPKWTAQHNTLTVDGRGQLGEGGEWFRGSHALAQRALPFTRVVQSTPAADHFLGDATQAYPPELGLTRFVRHVLFVKPSVLIVADDVALARPADLELRFHPEREATEEGTALLARGKEATLRIEPLTRDGVTVTAERQPLPGRHGRAGGEMFCVRLATHRAAWRNAVALSWSAAEVEPPRVTLTVEGDRWTFRSGTQTATLDWECEAE